MKKGILIDVLKRSFTEVEVGDYKDIQKKVDCRAFDVVEFDKKNDVYVDDEGLLNLTSDTMFFMVDGYPNPLAGNGLILGINTKTGNSVNTTLTVDEVKGKVKFYTMKEIQQKVGRGELD
jgi:hypothetical protein